MVISDWSSDLCSSDLLFELDEAPGVPSDDVEEVSNDVAALKHGLRRLREDDFPLSLRLIREMHALLLQGGRGASRQPGEFRKTQVWIGGATPALAHFVPPPPEALNDALAAFEAFLHAPANDTPPLVKAALAHVQFRSEEHTSELQSLMRNSYAVF